MLSWQLWQILHRPSYKNPIFIRVRKQASPYLPELLALRFHYPSHLNHILFVLFVIIVVQQPQIILGILKVVVLLLMAVICSPLLLPLLIIAYGIYLTMSVCSEISAEKQAATYDLLCISPDGSLSVGWRFASGILYRNESFMWLNTAVTVVLGLMGLIFFIVMALVAFMSMTEGGFTSLLQPIRMVIDVILFLGIVYTGYIHSIVLSVVIGLYVPSLDFYRRDGIMLSIFTYIILESIPYLVLVACITGFNYGFYGRDAGFDLLLDIIIFAMVFGLREIFIAFFWSRLVHRLNAAPDFIYPTTQIA